MKIIACLFIPLLYTLNAEAMASAIKGYPAKVTILVKDDLGDPIPNATVGLSTFKKWHPGEGFGRDENMVLTEASNEDGFVNFEFNCKSGRIAYGIRELEGYYRTGGVRYHFKPPIDGKCQPWNPTLELVLRRIVKPIPMFANNVGLVVPALNKELGFDFFVGDWVTPHGSGTIADMFIKLERKYKAWENFYINLEFKFPKAEEGLQTVTIPHINSKFKYDYEAFEEGYEKLWRQKMGNHPEKGRWGLSEDKENYIMFRIRSSINEEGVSSFFYGKILNGFRVTGYAIDQPSIHFEYILNPTPNDRNIEFDPEKNLFENAERKYAP